jgi:hypothetical protein
MRVVRCAEARKEGVKGITSMTERTTIEQNITKNAKWTSKDELFLNII